MDPECRRHSNMGRPRAPDRAGCCGICGYRGAACLRACLRPARRSLRGRTSNRCPTATGASRRAAPGNAERDGRSRASRAWSRAATAGMSMPRSATAGRWRPSGATGAREPCVSWRAGAAARAERRPTAAPPLAASPVRARHALAPTAGASTSRAPAGSRCWRETGAPARCASSRAGAAASPSPDRRGCAAGRAVASALWVAAGPEGPLAVRARAQRRGRGLSARSAHGSRAPARGRARLRARVAARPPVAGLRTRPRARRHSRRRDHSLGQGPSTSARSTAR